MTGANMAQHLISLALPLGCLIHFVRGVRQAPSGTLLRQATRAMNPQAERDSRCR